MNRYSGKHLISQEVGTIIFTGQKRKTEVNFPKTLGSRLCSTLSPVIKFIGMVLFVMDVIISQVHTGGAIV